MLAGAAGSVEFGAEAGVLRQQRRELASQVLDQGEQFVIASVARRPSATSHSGGAQADS